MKCNYIYLGCHKRYIEMFWMIWFCNFKVFKTSFWSGQWCTLSAHILQTQSTHSRTWKMLFFHETLILKWLHQVCYGGSEKNCMWHFYDENLHRPKWNSFLMNTEAWETVARYECDKKSSKRSCLCMLQLKQILWTSWHLQCDTLPGFSRSLSSSQQHNTYALWAVRHRSNLIHP